MDQLKHYIHQQIFDYSGQYPLIISSDNYLIISWYSESAEVRIEKDYYNDGYWDVFFQDYIKGYSQHYHLTYNELYYIIDYIMDTYYPGG